MRNVATKLRVPIYIYLAVLMVMLSVVNVVSAELVQGIDIDFVTIGNPGNAGDARSEIYMYGLPSANPAGCGSVAYEYQIGKYEITNGQWNAFVSAAGAPTGYTYSHAYDESATSSGTDAPTNKVSWLEAAQFCNYLTSGDKGRGAYQFYSYSDGAQNYLGIDRNSAISTYGTVYVIPNEDEWYKAAYYKPDGSGFSMYANGTDTAPVAGVDTNYVNYDGQPWDVDNGMMEQNGTFNMMGNLAEWNERVGPGGIRGVRGGSYNNFGDSTGWKFYISSSYTLGDNMASELDRDGFRVASIPEPATMAILMLGGIGILRRRKCVRK